MTLSEQRLQFARELADPDFSLSLPEPAKAVIRDLLAEVEGAGATIHAHDGYKMHDHWEECESVSELREALRFQGAMTHELIPHQERAIRAEAKIERALGVLYAASIPLGMTEAMFHASLMREARSILLEQGDES